MTKKEMIKYLEARTIEEIRTHLASLVEAIVREKKSIKRVAKEIIELDMSDSNYFNKFKDLSDSFKIYSKWIIESQKEIDFTRPYLEKRVSTEEITEEHKSYLNRNKEAFKVLKIEVDKLEIEALKSWEGIPVKLIKQAHEDMYLEMISILKGSIGDITEVLRIEYNNNRGFDGYFKGTTSTLHTNTILAGGYNIQKLHYRTLLNYI